MSVKLGQNEELSNALQYENIVAHPVGNNSVKIQINGKKYIVWVDEVLE